MGLKHVSHNLLILQLFAVMGMVFGSFSDLTGCLVNTVCQDVSDSLSFADFLDQGIDKLFITVFQMHAGGIRFGEDPLFIEIDGKCDATRQRQRIETIIGCQPVTFQIEVIIDDLAGTQKRMP